MNKSVCMISLGCAKNRVDGEIMLGKLSKSRYSVVENVLKADVVIVNTCGFIEDSKAESIEEILDVVALKNSKTIKSIIVTGCLAERYKSQVLAELSEVDAVIGIGSNSDIVSIVDDVLNGDKIESYGSKFDLPLNGERFLTTPKYSAYLKIADGCSNCCTYCAIPLIRGKFRSRRMEDVVQEAETLVKSGVKELLIIAQDTTRYGEDLYGYLALPELLKKICMIDGVKWIRILYCYPDRITNELIDVIANEDKIVKYLDIPLQHCNNRILRLMNRKGDTSKIEDMIHKIRTHIKDIVIRTSLIAGFPSETEKEFEELTEFCRRMKFERMGCFSYSQEEDTPASLMEKQIDDVVKRRRQEIIMEDQIEVMNNFARGFIGNEMLVLVEGIHEKKGHYFGRSYADAPEVDCKVIFKSIHGKHLNEGEFVKVKIEKNMGCDLVGKEVNNF